MRNGFAVEHPVARIILSGKRELEATVDYPDLQRAAEAPATWRAISRAGKIFAAVTIRRYDADTNSQIAEDALLHRWIIRAGPSDQVFHENGDGLDCRRGNLIVRRLARPRLGRQWAEIDQRAHEQSTLAWFAELRRRLEMARVKPRLALSIAQRLRDGQTPASGRMAELVERIQSEMRREGLSWPAAPRARLRGSWQDHVEEIAAELREMPPHQRIGREDVERLFRVSRASASRLLGQFGAGQVGNVYLIDAGELAARLVRLGAYPVVAEERERRERVLAAVNAEVRRQQARRVILDPPAPAPELPEGVALRPGELLIRYRTAEEAMSRMLALGLRAQEDWDKFREEIERGLQQVEPSLDVPADL